MTETEPTALDSKEVKVIKIQVILQSSKPKTVDKSKAKGYKEFKDEA